MKTYNLFISHSWSYSPAYENLVKLLSQRPYFSYHNYSVPKDDPIHTNGTDRQLYNAIKNQMLPSSVVLIVAGVYAAYSKWIDKEIYIAQKEFLSPKPIIAIRPRGNKRMSTKVTYAADKIVGWNTESVVSAIRELA